MKTFIEKNLKFIVGLSVIMVSLSIIGFLGVTYATDGTTSIYTRDELSEKLEALERKNDLKFTYFHSCKLGVSITDTSNPTVIPIEQWTSPTPELFSFENNELTINKTGSYLLALNAVIIPSISGMGKISIITNSDLNDRNNRTDAHYMTANVQSSFDRVDFYPLTAGTKFKLMSFSTVPTSFDWACLSALYLGE